MIPLCQDFDLSLCLTARRRQSQAMQRQWKCRELEPVSWEWYKTKSEDQKGLHEIRRHDIPNTRVEGSKPVLFVALSSSFEIVNNTRKGGVYYSLHGWSWEGSAMALDEWTKPKKINKSYSKQCTMSKDHEIERIFILIWMHYLLRKHEGR